jgi:ABC-type glycerol-3-phosphate transport system substrate-binding protein
MKAHKRKIIILAVCIVAVAFIASFVLVQVKDRTYFHSPPYSPKQDKDSTVLVVYYSRSGNTEAMAREVARKFNADIPVFALSSFDAVVFIIKRVENNY